MTEIKLGAVETRFAGLIWNNEPLFSGELVRLCETELRWKNQLLIQFCGGCVSVEFFKTRMGWFLLNYQSKGSMPCRVKNLWKKHLRVHCRNF